MSNDIKNEIKNMQDPKFANLCKNERKKLRKLKS